MSWRHGAFSLSQSQAPSFKFFSYRNETFTLPRHQTASIHTQANSVISPCTVFAPVLDPFPSSYQNIIKSLSLLTYSYLQFPVCFWSDLRLAYRQPNLKKMANFWLIVNYLSFSPQVHRMDNFIHWTSHYPEYKIYFTLKVGQDFHTNLYFESAYSRLREKTLKSLHWLKLSDSGLRTTEASSMGPLF